MLLKSIKFNYNTIKSRPVYYVVIIIGLSLAMFSILLIYFWVLNELSYEKFHPEYNRVFRVLTLSKQGDNISKSSYCYSPVAEIIKSDYPQVEYAALVNYDSEDSPFEVEGQGTKIELRMCWVNQDFFHVFKGFRFIEGSIKLALSKPENVIISEETAKKLFGDKSALGETIVRDKYSRKLYTVGGVIEVPVLSHLDLDIVSLNNNDLDAFDTDNWYSRSNIYVKLEKRSVSDEKFLQSVSNLIIRNSVFNDRILFQPLADIHLFTDYEPSEYDKNISHYKYIWLFTGIGIGLLLMASINYSVISVARFTERSNEIRIRKTWGARNYNILFVFIFKLLLQVLFSALIALFLLRLSLPLINRLLSIEISFTFDVTLITRLSLFILVFSLITGLVPSVDQYLFTSTSHSRREITVFRQGLLRVLLVVQFTIAIFFIIVTFLINRQLNFIYGSDLGLDSNNVVVFHTGLWYDNQEFKRELVQHPNIECVSASRSAPVDFPYVYYLIYNKQGNIDSLRCSFFWVDEDFVDTYKLELIKGSFLQMDNNESWSELAKYNTNRNSLKEPVYSIPIVINETAERILGNEDPLGLHIGDYVIVGVVRDFNFRSLHHPIGPLVLLNDPQNIMTMSVRIGSTDSGETINYIKDTYQKHRNERVLSYHFFDDLIRKEYQDENLLRNMALLFSIIAIALSVLGIFGMAAFIVDLRKREVAIRMVAGATRIEMILMLNLDFVKYIIIAFLIAAPISIIVMNRWLQNFASTTGMQWWIFGIAFLIALAIEIVTVNHYCLKIVNKHVVRNLKSL